MGDVVISVDRIGKRYRIRHEQTARYTALRDVVGGMVLDELLSERERIGKMVEHAVEIGPDALLERGVGPESERGPRPLDELARSVRAPDDDDVRVAAHGGFTQVEQDIELTGDFGTADDGRDRMVSQPPGWPAAG